MEKIITTKDGKELTYQAFYLFAKKLIDETIDSIEKKFNDIFKQYEGKTGIVFEKWYQEKKDEITAKVKIKSGFIDSGNRIEINKDFIIYELPDIEYEDLKELTIKEWATREQQAYIHEFLDGDWKYASYIIQVVARLDRIISSDQGTPKLLLLSNISMDKYQEAELEYKNKFHSNNFSAWLKGEYNKIRSSGKFFVNYDLNSQIKIKINGKEYKSMSFKYAENNKEIDKSIYRFLFHVIFKSNGFKIDLL